MTVKIATATNHIDLLAQIDAALTQQGHAWGKTYAGVGNGTIQDWDGGSATVAEAVTITATSGTSFSVVGSVSGAIGTATTGTPFVDARVKFKINAGSTAFQAGDAFSLTMTPAWTRKRMAGCRGELGRTGDWTSLQNAFDANSNTLATKAALPGTAVIELVEPAEVRAVRLTAGQYGNRMPTAFTLSHSADGVAWTETASWSAIDWASNTARTLTIGNPPGAFKFWRLVATAQGAGVVGAEQNEIARIELLPQAGAQWSLESRIEFAWEAPGPDGIRKALVGGFVYENPGVDTYSFGLFGFRAWDNASSVDSQLNGSGVKSIGLWNGATPFWLFVNGQRMALVAKVSTVFQAAYLGFGLPYGTPTEHPHPLVIAGTGDDVTRRWSSDAVEHRTFNDPGRYGMAALMPGNTWVQFANRWNQTGAPSDDGSADTVAQTGKVMPSARAAGIQDRLTRQGIDGTVGLKPIELIVESPPHPWGELDGAYWCSGFGGNGAENVVLWEGFQHLVVQNIGRTQAHHYFAMRMD